WSASASADADHARVDSSSWWTGRCRGRVDGCSCCPGTSGSPALLAELRGYATGGGVRDERRLTGREISARCILRDEALCIEVSDASDDLPQPRQASSDDESGRGPALVAALADE
ncbi:hypothetical protein ABZW18_25640, partial [Streptomyces sp. NPDC004647]